MTPDEYRQHLLTIVLAARALVDVPVDEMLRAIDRADSLGPILDPTLWITRNKAMQEDAALLRAAHPLVEYAQHMRTREAVMRQYAEDDSQ